MAAPNETLDIREFKDAADTAALHSTVSLLSGRTPLPSGSTIVSRNIHHPHINDARDRLIAQFEAIEGLQVRTESFDAEGETDLVNIIAELRPPDSQDLAWVIVGAHYDSIADLDDSGSWTATTDPAPGADDDASGVAATLEIARILSEWPGGYHLPLRFVLFSAEEYGLLGSFRHVEGILRRGEQVRLMLSMDPIGYNPAGQNLLWFSYDARSQADADALQELGAGLRTGLEVTGVDEQLIGGDRRSDHYPFWAQGFPALHLGSFPQPPAYHTMSDTIDVVDSVFLSSVTGLVAVYVADIAQPQPLKSGCGADSARSALPLVLLPTLVVFRRKSQ